MKPIIADINCRIALSVMLVTLTHTAAAAGLKDTTWLYTVEQPVASQSVAARSEAAGRALLVVLSRLTGLVSVPRNEQVRAALEQPERYYNQFVFFEKPQPGTSAETMVRFSFSESAVQRLIDAAALPVWWRKRPKVMLWMVVEAGNSREIVEALSEHPLVQAIQQRARERGLDVILPLMDLDDSLAVSAADVWGKVGQSLDTASARYDADLVLVARISEMGVRNANEATFRGDWEVWLQGQPLASNFNNLDAQSAAVQGIDMLADSLAERYAVLPRQQTTLSFSVTGLEDAASYAAFMRYIEGFEFVAQVQVAEIDANALRVALLSRARLEQLLMLLTSDQRLVEDRLHRGLETQLIWQG